MSAIIVKSFVGQAEAYFAKELTNERENYYSEKATRAGQWTGKGAEVLGLTGEIKKEDFSRMSRGITPSSGKRFRRMTLGRTREINGEIKQVKEIAGWDMVISAPKSVSIAGLIGRDESVRAAHREAVTDALERAERQAQSNNGGGKKQQTGNLVVARFSHDSARPSRGGFVAPQLHDHCFIMNATQRADGTLKPLESLELHRAQSYIKSVYYTGLADRLQKLGYAVEIERETGAPEITGISKEYRQACSPRRAEILELAKKAGRNFRQLGLVNRREKIFDKDLIQEQHRDIDKLFDSQAKQVVESARENPRLIEENSVKAQEAVTFALSKLSERESVFNPRVVLLEANKRGIGQTSVAAIEAELETRKKDGQVKIVSLRDGREAAFLSSDEKIESQLPQHIKAVQPTDTLLNEILKTKIPDSVKADDEIEFRKLSDEQQKAVGEIMRATTGVTTLEGRAGVGKTTTLSFVGKMAEKAEYEVLGLAPTTGAAQELDNAQITSATLQKLLASQDAPRDHKRFFIVDESSFVSSRQMDKFFREAVKQGDRVLLVGDTRQHEGVEAGKPFARMQSEELATGARVETIRRQRKETMRETVEKLSEGKIIEAVSEMRERGQIREIKDRAERHNSIVEAFTTAPERNLVVAPRDADRQAINRKIHWALKESGKIGKEEIEIKILRPSNGRGGVKSEFAVAYREGDIITYTRGSRDKEIPAKSRAKVVKIDQEQNLLIVEIKGSGGGTKAREITYNPKRLRGVSVWTEEKIKVSEGDRLQLRAPFEEKQMKIAGGAMFEVGKINTEAITLRGNKGETIKLDTREPHAIDYGYAVTSHSSRGKMIDRVLIHAEVGESKQILNERMAYVAVSPARDEALIFTDDAAKLLDKLARKTQKHEIADVSHKFEQQKNLQETTVTADLKAEITTPETVTFGKTKTLKGRANGHSNEPLFANLTDEFFAPVADSNLSDTREEGVLKVGDNITTTRGRTGTVVDFSKDHKGNPFILYKDDGNSNEEWITQEMIKPPAAQEKIGINGVGKEPENQNTVTNSPSVSAKMPETATGAPKQTADAQPEQQPTAKLSNSDYAVLNAQIIVRQAELSDLKFDETLLNRDTEIKRFDVFIEPAKGREVSTAAAAKTIDRIEFLRLRSTNEPLAPPPGDEANRAKWSMTDVNAAREVLTETRDFIKAEKNSRDENKWHSQQNLKNLFDNHLNPLKMAENHLNMLTPDGLANHFKNQVNPLSLIENHPVVQVVISLRDMKNAAEQAAMLGRIESELTAKLYRLNTHITNEVVDRITDAREAGRSAVSQKQNEIDELKELTKNAPEAVKPDFTAEELEKISVSAIRAGDHNLMYDYQKAAVENAKRIESDKLRFGKEYNETYKNEQVDKFSARAMRELENTPVTESQAAVLVEKGGKYPKNMLDALHQMAEIKGEDYVKRLADAHRASGKADFPQIETFDKIDVLAHADGQKVVADLRAAELENEFERRFAADKVNDSFSEARAEAGTVVENAKQMADYLGKISADFRVSLINEGMNPNVAPVVSQSESALVKFDELKEKVGVYDKPQMATGIETAPVKTTEILRGATDAAAQHHEADAAKRELQERAASASRTRAVQAESVSNSIGIDM